MTEQKLNEIEARCEKVMPVWNVENWDNLTLHYLKSKEGKADADFIRQAHKDIPALIAALREAWKERDGLLALCGELAMAIGLSRPYADDCPIHKVDHRACPDGCPVNVAMGKYVAAEKHRAIDAAKKVI